MNFLKFIFRNAFRHKLRTFLTILGLAIAVLAFVLMRTVVGAWYAGVDASSANRLVVVHSVSFVFHLPLSYHEKIAQVKGINKVGYAEWFGGIYKDRNFANFFARYAVDDNFIQVYPEFIIPPDQLAAFEAEGNACIVGQKTAKQHGFKIGDIVPIKGDIFPGKWQFVVRGIYKGRERSTDETAMLFKWKYLDESLRKTAPVRAGHVGWYVIQVAHPSESARISEDVDSLFRNSPAPTKTETEKAFAQSFVSMSGAILTALNFVSYVIIGIILLVLANTMAMTARERNKEYAVLKTLGFTGKHLVLLIGSESLLIALLGAIVGLPLGYLAIHGFQSMFITMFPILPKLKWIMILGGLTALAVGVVAALFPALRASKMRIADGLRQIG